VALSTLLQLAALYVPPLAALLGLTPLILTEWMVVAGLAAVPAVVGQAAKLWRQRQRSVML